MYCSFNKAELTCDAILLEKRLGLLYYSTALSPSEKLLFLDPTGAGRARIASNYPAPGKFNRPFCGKLLIFDFYGMSTISFLQHFFMESARKMISTS